MLFNYAKFPVKLPLEVFHFQSYSNGLKKHKNKSFFIKKRLVNEGYANLILFAETIELILNVANNGLLHN